MAMKSPPAADALEPETQEMVASTLAAYAPLLPPEAMSELRELLEDVAGTHPVALTLRRRLRPRSARARSGEEAVEPGAEGDDTKRGTGSDR